MILCKAIRMAHYVMRKCLHGGEKAIDATAGKGFDTELLATLVGPKGRVFAFDIQEKALRLTAERLRQKGLGGNVALIQDGHENLANYGLPPVKAIMFNLGYLPGENHRIITRPATTVKAVLAATEILQKDGIISIVIYSGHPGGKEERDALLDELTKLNQEIFQVACYNFLNRTGSPPELILIEKYSSASPRGARQI